MSNHSFNPILAKIYGTFEAIFIDSFIFWTRTNASKADDKENNFFEGRFWCYGTPEYFSKYFFYLTHKQIRYVLEKLIKKGVLVKGNFNKKGYDKTNWYSLSDKILSELNLDKTCLQPALGLICQNWPMHLTKLADAFDKIGEPIPDTKPDTKPDKNTTTSNNDFFEGYKEKEEASLSKLISDNEIKNRRDKAKDYALKNNRCLEAFEALWSGLDVDLNEAYDDCQSWHDSQGKNIIIGWGTFLHYLKNDLNRRKFAPIKKIAECKSSNTPLSLGSNHIDWNEREIENKLSKEVKEARRNNGMKKCGDLFKLLGQG